MKIFICILLFSVSGFAKDLDLTESEREILSRGPISTERYVIGGILGTYPLGFGIGHAIQGRYKEIGWVFTVGQLGSGMLMITGMTGCLLNDQRRNNCDSGLVAVGGLAFLGFKVWEIVDLWAVPPEINRRYQELRQRTGQPTVSIRPAIVPTNDGGLLLGMNISF